MSNEIDAGTVAIRVSGEGGCDTTPSPFIAVMCETAATPRPCHPFPDRSGARSAAAVIIPTRRGVSVSALAASPVASAGR